jgi:hypothetical protein
MSIFVTMNMGPPTEMDVLLHTNMSQVPTCEILDDCRAYLADDNATVDGLGRDPTWILGRMACLYDVKVPAYNLAWMRNISDSAVIQDAATGQIYFAERVCVCDVTWGLSGQNCEPTDAGIALRYLFLALALWFIFLVLRGTTLLTSGRFASVRKRTLAVMALLLYASQTLWVLSTRAAIEVLESSSMRFSLQAFSFSASTLLSLASLCGLMLDTTVFIRKDPTKSQSKNDERKLRRVETLFKIIPVAVTVLSAVVFIFQTAAGLLLIGACQALAVVLVAAAFWRHNSILGVVTAFEVDGATHATCGLGVGGDRHVVLVHALRGFRKARGRG